MAEKHGRRYETASRNTEKMFAASLKKLPLKKLHPACIKAHSLEYIEAKRPLFGLQRGNTDG